MGEHADDGDREDEEPSVPSSDDSPPEHIDDDEAHDAERDEDADADEARASDDTPATDSADDESASESTEQREEADDVEPAEGPPSAEEWLEENPDYESGMEEFEDVGTEGEDDAEDDADGDGDEGAVDDDGDEAEADSSGADDDPNRIEEGDSLSAAEDDGAEDGSGDGETGDGSGDETDDDSRSDEPSPDEADEPLSAREARARAQADDRSPEEQEAELNLDDGEDAPDTSTSMSTSDPGSNAPAGMGKPTPAGGGGGGGGATGTGGSFPGFDEDMAPDDQEQPLTEHIEEMTHRFLYVALVMGLVASVALLWSDQMINFLWYSFLGPTDGTCPGLACPVEWRPHLYHPLSLLLARLKMAALVGFVAGLPVAVYQTYRFMRPGLYPHERRYYLAAVPTSLVLAIVGVGFAYYVVLPSLFIYFAGYSTQAAELAFALSDTFGLMVMMLGFFALIFQIPLLVMLAIMMGVTTRRWLEQRRLYFWTGFGGVAFLFSPDPTGMAPLLVAVTMIALFEGTLLLLRWTERSVALFSAQTLETYRPYAWALAAFVGYAVSSLPVPESYFSALPPVLVETLAEYGYLGFTPAVVGGAIVIAFEALGWIARRLAAARGRRTGLRARLAFMRIRPFGWLVGIVAGYMASPDPILLDVIRDVSVSTPVAIGIAAGLIVAYEALRFVLSYVRPE